MRFTPGDFVRAQKNSTGYSFQSDAQRQIPRTLGGSVYLAYLICKIK